MIRYESDDYLSDFYGPCPPIRPGIPVVREGGAFLAPVGTLGDEEDESVDAPVPSGCGLFDREVVENVWDFAEIVPGVDPALWRKDEFGAWIRRLDYGRRESLYGWEVFDPGLGRRAHGVYAMRPMQWESYVRQYEAFA